MRYQVTIRVMSWLLLLGITTLGAQESRQRSRPQVIDVRHYEIEASIVPEKAFLQGEVKITFRTLEDSMSIPFELNKRLTLLDARDEADVQYASAFDDFESSRMRVRAPETLSRGTEKTLTLRFEGTLEKEEYAFLDTPQSEPAIIDADGALFLSEGKWFPMHALPLDAATATVRITVPLGFTVVAPGELESIETVGISEVFTWNSDRELTHLPVVVARFFRQTFEELAVPITFFVTEEFEEDLNPLVEEITRMLEFYRSRYGEIPIPALHFVQVGNVQLRSSGCAGLVLLESSLLDQHSLPVMELATRIAHQWWGYSVRFEKSSDAWLQDGFSTYAALQYYGQKYTDQFSTELARQAVSALKYESKAPISRGLELEIGSPEYRSIVGSKGAWVLYMLSQLTGEQKFQTMLSDWYRENTDQAVSTGEFADFVERQTGENYQWFFVQWVDSVGTPQFRTEYTIYRLREGGFKIRGQIRQNIELFRMPMDVVIETKEEPEQEEIMVNGKSTSFTFETETMPIRVRPDPQGKILHDSGEMRVLVHVALGEEYLESGEFVSAVREFEKAIELDPRKSLAHYRLGETFFEQRNYSSAANSFRDSLNGDLNPRWVETWTHIYLGKIYDILGQRQRAMAEYQKAINTRIDYNGAQAEAERYLKEPFSKPSGVLG